MTDRDSPPPKPDARTERERRLAEALRANLKRRKEQSRGRAEGAEPKDGERETERRGDSE